MDKQLLLAYIQYCVNCDVITKERALESIIEMLVAYVNDYEIRGAIDQVMGSYPR